MTYTAAPVTYTGAPMTYMASPPVYVEGGAVEANAPMMETVVQQVDPGMMPAPTVASMVVHPPVNISAEDFEKIMKGEFVDVNALMGAPASTTGPIAGPVAGAVAGAAAATGLTSGTTSEKSEKKKKSS